MVISKYQTMTAEGIANQKNCPIARKDSVENANLEFLQDAENLIYNTSTSTYNQFDTQIAIAAPPLPIRNLYIRTQLIGT